jgi:hypothetical protein
MSGSPQSIGKSPETFRLVGTYYQSRDAVSSRPSPPLLAIVTAGILLLGLLERRDGTVLGMGYDSAAMLVVFLGGVGILYGLPA